MENRFLFIGWIISCVGLWLAIARDPITTVFCAGVTVPFTLLFFIGNGEYKTHKTR